MKIIDQRTMAATEEFGELPIGAVFEFPESSEAAGYFGPCMKIAAAVSEDNAFDLKDSCILSLPHNESVCALNAHLVIEGKW